MNKNTETQPILEAFEPGQEHPPFFHVEHVTTISVEFLAIFAHLAFGHQYIEGDDPEMLLEALLHAGWEAVMRDTANFKAITDHVQSTTAQFGIQRGSVLLAGAVLTSIGGIEGFLRTREENRKAVIENAFKQLSELCESPSHKEGVRTAAAKTMISDMVTHKARQAFMTEVEKAEQTN